MSIYRHFSILAGKVPVVNGLVQITETNYNIIQLFHNFGTVLQTDMQMGMCAVEKQQSKTCRL